MADRKNFDIEHFPTSPSGQRMLSDVTAHFYDKSYVMKWLYQIMGIEYDEMRDFCEEDLINQLFPETATWGLKYHEIKWHLPVRENLPYEERRKRIYAKRDYRAPMTPYRMEQAIANATGFVVTVADVHDPSHYNFHPKNPNVFRVYFVGEGTLDSRAAKETIDRIKQSHTVYRMVDISTFNTGDLNKTDVWLRKIIFRMGISFWYTELFNGRKNFDGSLLFNASRRYGLVLGFKYKLEGYHNSIEEKLKGIRFRTQEQTSDDIGMKQKIIMAENFWTLPVIFNGNISFDGSRKFYEERRYGLRMVPKFISKTYFDSISADLRSMTTKTHIREQDEVRAHQRIISKSEFWGTEAQFDGSVTFDKKRIGRVTKAKFVNIASTVNDVKTDNVSVQTFSRNYRLMDGSITFSGSRSFNSIYRKEQVQ